MENLEESGLIPVLEQKVRQEQTPILGICLGMQLLTNKSEEGQVPGLGWVDGEALRFDASNEVKKFPVPHMGWEYVSLKKNSALFHDMYEDPKFYFAHTYFVKCSQPDEVILTADYIREFDAGFQKGNILGVQFHPEKSHKYGMKLLSNFITHF
ncbi:Imidazole glycerol phosphate synthase subunit HisH 1 [compost metagenome]